MSPGIAEDSADDSVDGVTALTGAFAYLARRACCMNARRTAFMRVW